MTSSTTQSWINIVRKADENFDKERLYPVAYEFSSGRQFRERPGMGAYSTATGTSS